MTDSICCGATINYQDFCSECGEHTGAIQFEDADGKPVTQYVNADGFLKDEWRSEDGCCNECFVTSHDVQRGFLTVAVPEGCGDEDCECHEYEPNFKGFVSTVTPKEIATVGLVVLMFVSIWFAA